MASLTSRHFAGVVGYTSAANLNSNAGNLYNNELQAVSSIKEVAADLYQMQVAVRQAAIDTDPAQIQAQVQLVNQLDTTLNGNLTTYLNLQADDPESQQATLQIQQSYKTYKAAADNALALSQQTGDADVQAIAAAEPAAAAVEDAIDKRVKAEETDAGTAYNSGVATFAQSRNEMIGTVALAILLGIGIALSLSGALAGAAGQMVGVAQGIARGELDHTITVKSKDEMEEMGLAFQQMISYLQGMGRAAERLAEGDLTAEVRPQSSRDVLGNAFANMVGKLREVVGQIDQSAVAVAGASEQSASAAEQAGTATTQVTSTIQQVSQGTTSQASQATQAASGRGCDVWAG